MKRRAAMLLAVFTLLVATVGITAPSAEASTACKGYSAHYGISDGSVPTKVGWVELAVELCTNGTEITSTYSNTDSDTSGPGDAAGFDIDFYAPHRKNFHSGSKTSDGYGTVYADGRLRDCIPYTTLACGLSETFRVWMNFRMYKGKAIVLPPKSIRKPGLGNIGSRTFLHQWKKQCTNKVCGVHFH